MRKWRRWLLGCILGLGLSAAVLHAQETDTPTQRYEDASIHFDYPAHLNLSSDPAEPVVMFRQGLGQIRLHVFHEDSFNHADMAEHGVSPEQTPLEMLRSIIALMKESNAPVPASLEDVDEIELADGRAALLLQSAADEGPYADHLTLLIFPLRDGRTWLAAAEFEHIMLVDVVRQMLLEIAASIQPVDSVVPDIDTLHEFYQTETIRLIYPAGLEVEHNSQGLDIETDDMDLEYALIKPEAFAALAEEEGLDLDSSMTPQAMMIAFVRAMAEESDETLSLEDARPASLSDGRDIITLHNVFPEGDGMVILYTFPVTDEVTTLAGVFIGDVPPSLADLIGPAAEQPLVQMVESLRLSGT